MKLKTINIFILFKLFFLMTNPALYSQQQQLLISDFQVNENAGWCDHFDPKIAVHADGSFIIVWHDYKNTHADIYLQRFDSNLNRIGDDILVNDDGGLSNQIKPDVDIDISGRFIVTWIDNRFGKGEIYAQRFDSLANPLGNNFSVNEGKGNFSEYSNPSIALSQDGNFVITWLENRDNEFGIYARLYDHNGEDVSNIFKVNNQNNSIDEYVTPDAGMDDRGNFAVVWEDLRQNLHRDIFVQRFDTEGNKLGENFKVNDDDNDRYHGNPSVSVFPDGGFVITWIDERNYFYDIYAQRFDNSGVPVESNFMVNDVEDGQQFTPIVCTSLSGRFVIIWKDERERGVEGGTILFDIFSQIYDKNGTPVGANTKIHDDENSMYYLTPPAADMDSTGNFIITWNDKQIGNYQIYAQKYDPQGNLIDTVFQVNTDEGSGNQHNPTICAADSGHFVIVWEDFRNGNADIYLQDFSGAGESMGENHLVNDDITASEQSTPQMGIDSKGNLFIVWQDYRDEINNIYGQRFDSYLQPVGSNFRINENSPEYGTWFPKIAMNRAGSCVIIWLESAWADLNIYAQRYDGAGNKLGDNFKVNDDIGYIPDIDFLYENEFAVGIDDNNNYVISWTEYRNDIRGISFKIYDSEGNPVKDIDRVHFDDSTFVHNYSMSMGVNGYFVISWINWKYNNIYAQLYNAFGEPLGNNLLINNFPGIDYRDMSPTLSMNENGDFCIGWQDNREGHFDIYGQIYSSDGKSIDTNFKINSNIDISHHKNPALYLKNNRLYTVWEDNRVPRQGWDIFTNVISFEELTAITNSNEQSNPGCYILFQNYPNPFNNSTRIFYQLSSGEHVSIKIYNSIGQLIKTVVDEFKESGIHNVSWNGKNHNNAAVVSGLYFCKIFTSNYQKTIKLIILK